MFAGNSTEQQIFTESEVFEKQSEHLHFCIVFGRISKDMADKNDTIGYICVPQSTGNSAIILQFIALPFHLLMMKILVKDLRLALPRHKITFSLSLSDCLLISVISLSAVIMEDFELNHRINGVSISATCSIVHRYIIYSCVWPYQLH